MEEEGKGVRSRLTDVGESGEGKWGLRKSEAGQQGGKGVRSRLIDVGDS